MIDLSTLYDLLDIMHNPVFVVSRDTLHILYGNQIAQTTTGYSSDDLQTFALADLYIQPVELPGLLERITPGHPVSYEQALKPREGAPQPATTRIGLWDIDGTPCLICTVQLQTRAASITDIEAQLRQERNIANTLYDVGTILTSTLDQNELLQKVLKQTHRLVEYDAANIMLIQEDRLHIAINTGYEPFGLSSEQVNTITFTIDQMRLIRDMMQNKSWSVCSHTATDPNWIQIPGADWIKSWLGVPLVVKGEVVGIFSLDSTQPGFFTGEHARQVNLIVQQAAIAFENARLFNDIQALEQVKSDMIRMASHDLRSPVTRIRGFLTRLEESLVLALDEQQRTYFAKTWKATHEIERIIDNILSLERIEARHNDFQPINWCALVNNARESLSAEMNTKQHHLSIHCASNLPAVRGDPVQLGQVVINLLSNAIKYTPPGGDITITV
ncbi:MAG: GAF domain-containing protein, partial [Anaerolineae bacterium]|nr:GAF domain-containing protein [Anaerolineae bacterium]